MAAEPVATSRPCIIRQEAGMQSMFLAEVETHDGQGRYAQVIRQLRGQGLPVPQIMHLFAFKPDRTEHLAEFTHGVMRGTSPLPAGTRELIAAFISRQNACPF
jgi:alkylhydroperoxidase family enzyme